MELGELRIEVEIQEREVLCGSNARIEDAKGSNWISGIIEFRSEDICCFGNINDINLLSGQSKGSSGTWIRCEEEREGYMTII